MIVLTCQTILGNDHVKRVGEVSNSLVYRSDEILIRPDELVYRLDELLYHPDELLYRPDELYIVRTL